MHMACDTQAEPELSFRQEKVYLFDVVSKVSVMSGAFMHNRTNPRANTARPNNMP